MQAFLRRIPLTLLMTSSLFALAVPPAVAQGVNGTLGLFFDDRGQVCSTSLAPGHSATLWVLLIPQGDTIRGISGAEFRIDTSGAPGYVFSQEEVVLPDGFPLGGPAVGSGINVVSTSGCASGAPIPILKIRVQNVGGDRDGVLRIAAKIPPFNPSMDCPLVTLCDEPYYTSICMEMGPKNIAVLNPSGSVPCGSTAENSQWGAVKELYR